MPENATPVGSVAHTAESIDFSFGIPAVRGEQGIQGERGEQGMRGEQGPKGDKGDVGNVLFATFQVDPTDRKLYMTTADAYTGPVFQLNYETRRLEVSVGSA